MKARCRRACAYTHPLLQTIEAGCWIPLQNPTLRDSARTMENFSRTFALQHIFLRWGDISDPHRNLHFSELRGFAAESVLIGLPWEKSGNVRVTPLRPVLQHRPGIGAD